MKQAAIPLFHSSLSKCTIQTPDKSQIPELRQLWKDTVGDSDVFLDIFYETAFSLERCLCVTYTNFIVGALYWFDCEFSNQKIAYIYAVATAKEFRGHGICHALMEHTHVYLKENGYAGAILSPAEERLFDFYGKMGYETCTYIREIDYDSSINLLPKDAELEAASFEHTNIEIRQISKTEFAKLRRSFLPKTAVIQECENLDFLEQQASFYAGENFLLAAQISDISENELATTQKHLNGIEFLGDESDIPAIVHTLTCTSGTFRTIGTEKPFGMYYPFANSNLKPSYISFIFD